MPDEYHVAVDPQADNNPHSIALRMIGGGHRVLEVGCWSGHVTEHLVAAGNTVIGVEIDPDAARRNTFAERIHIVDLDIVRLSAIEEARFDVILLGDVLEHLRDPAATLGDLVNLLTEDGVLIVSIPNVAHIDVRLHLLSGRWEYQPAGLLDNTHLRWFTRSSLRELLTSVGFVATELEPVRFERDTAVLGADEPIPHDVLRYIDADPDSRVFQFVVTARRADGRDDLHDALTPLTIDRVDIDAERAEDIDRVRADIAELRAAIAARDAELDAWRNAKLTRATRPLRALYARMRRG